MPLRRDPMTRREPIIVVTRPAPDHSALVGALSQRGYRAVHSPAFQIEPYDSETLDRALAALDRFDRVIVTSPAAARILVEHGRGTRDGAAQRCPTGESGPGFIAPGKGTARILEDAGLATISPAHGGTSEDVLGLPALERAEGLDVAIVGAPGGRDAIRQELTRRGARVKRLYLYRRVPQPPPLRLLEVLRAGAELVVLISSMKALYALTEALTDKRQPALLDAWMGSTFIASSERLARACRDAGAGRVERAAGAANNQMLDALEALPEFRFPLR